MSKINKIYWARANIIVECDNISSKSKIFLINEQEKIELKCFSNKIQINITNIPEGKMIEPGKWSITIDDELLKINDNITNIIDDLTRVFKYDKDKYACIVTFSFNENLQLFINIDFMVKNYKYKKRFIIIEGKNLKDKMLIIFKSVLILLINILYKFFCIINFKKQKILFLTENENYIQPNLNLVYCNISNNKEICAFNTYDKNFNKINYIKELFYISQAKFILIDNYIKIFNIINISKKTKIIQLWHAGVGFKAVGYARFGKNAGPHPFFSSHRKNDYIIVDNKNLINIYKEVFGVKSETFIPCGIPRLEKYLEKEIIDSTTNYLLEKYEKLKNKKIILFAPTYRGNGHQDAHYDIDNLNLKDIDEFCKKNNFIFIIKMHPFVNKKLIKNDEYDTIIQLEKEEINDLIYISDILITDYSSCVYEFSLFNRPIILYKYDKQIYENERPIHTLEVFSKLYEVINSEELIEILNKLKDVDIEKRFLNINKMENKSIETITKIIRGE